MSDVADPYQRNMQWAARGSYTTTLTPAQEQQFQAWIWKNKIPYDMSASGQARSDYDMRGYWLAMQKGDPLATQSESTQHFPDKWKTPYHATFSNESMYATPDAPRWQGDRLVDKYGNLIADETPR